MTTMMMTVTNAFPDAGVFDGTLTSVVAPGTVVVALDTLVALAVAVEVVLARAVVSVAWMC